MTRNTLSCRTLPGLLAGAALLGTLHVAPANAKTAMMSSKMSGTHMMSHKMGMSSADMMMQKKMMMHMTMMDKKTYMGMTMSQKMLMMKMMKMGKM